jgi:hypothetical protein
VENLTGKDISEFYEMNAQQVRDNVRSARGYDFIDDGQNAWNVRYFKKKYQDDLYADRCDHGT